jgi:hypothetical protein
MSRISNVSKGETFTFRLDQALKAALTRSAAEAHMQPAELVRELVRSHLTRQARRAFEAEARRQSLAIAERARHSGGDEAELMRDLEAHLERDDFGGEWKA